MRTQQEVDTLYGEATVQVAEGQNKFPGMTYEEGVEAALSWVLENGDDPLKDG